MGIEPWLLLSASYTSIPGRYFSLRAFLKIRREKERRKRGRYLVWDERNTFWAWLLNLSKNEKKIKPWRIEGDTQSTVITTDPKSKLFSLNFLRLMNIFFGPFKNVQLVPRENSRWFFFMMVRLRTYIIL